MANISIRYKIAQKVRSWRLKQGYTQKDLAGKIGVTYQIVLQYEKGTRKISIEKLYAIAKVLSVTNNKLFLDIYCCFFISIGIKP